MLQNIPNRPHGKCKYPKAMCPQCKHFDTVRKTEGKYLCRQCKICFTLHADGTTKYNAALGKTMRAAHAEKRAEKHDSLKAVQASLEDIGFGVGPIATREYSKRPVCGGCGRSVTGRSFYHRSTGDKMEVVCHRCIYGAPKLFQFSYREDTRNV